ncbi:MAG: DUF975 family protein [Tannerellaceae bacterium]|jgi:hypothetical protein|nr:DUF975 family protein [Tannerellaceae bacterium]
MKTNFSLSLILSNAWDALKANFWVLLGIVIAYMLLSFIISLLQAGGGFVGFIVGLLSIVLSIIFGLGYTRMCLDAAAGKEPQFSSFQEQLPKFWRYLGLSFLIGFAAVIWMILTLFIVIIVSGASAGGPGDFMVALATAGAFGLLLFFVLQIPLIYLVIRLQFGALFIVDTDCGVFESLRKSWALTQGYELKLFLLMLVMMGLCIAGVIALIVGVFVAAVLVSLMQVVAYKQLTTQE